MSRAVARGRRVRSQDQETGSTNSRVIGAEQVTTEKVKDRAVREIKQWPGQKQIRPGDLTSGTVDTIVEVAGNNARPALVLLSADDVAVADDDPQPIAFGTVVREQLTGIVADTSEIVWPWGGSVQFWIEGAWDDVDPGDGIAEILVDDVVVWSCRVTVGHDGVTVLVEATSVAVADSTDVDIEFDTDVQRERHSGEVPVTGIVWPLSSIVQFYVAGRWDTYPASELETVEVLVDDVAVWPPSWSPLPGVEYS